jgi:cobalamin biosynthesis protein CobT
MKINPNAALMRSAVERVVGLLTASKIKVTMRGSGAYVQYSSTGAIELVNLPCIADDASDEFLAAVQGFLDHEVAHVLFSDPKDASYAKMDPRVVSLADIIEDVYIERRMAGVYSGSEFNLNKVREFFVDRIAGPKIKELVAAGDEKQAKGWLIVQQMRAWGGQRASQEWLDKSPYASILTDFVKVIGDLADQIKLVNSTKDGLYLAERMIKRLEEDETRKKEEEKAKEKAKEESKKKPEPKPEPEPEGEKEKGEGGEPEPDGASDGKEEDADEGEGEPKGEGKEADKPAEGTESKGGASVKKPEKKEEGKAKPEKKESKSEEKPGAAAPSEEKDEGEGEEEGGGVSSLEALDSKGLSFDDAMAEKLSELGAKSLAESSYAIPTRDFDLIEPARSSTSATAIERLSSMGAMVAQITKKLERAIAARSRVGFNPGMRKGRINAPALHRVASGDDRVFREKYETSSKSTAISLLIDCSGSMSSGDKIGTAGKAAYALSAALERLRVRHEVLGFTTCDSREFSKLCHSEPKKGEKWIDWARHYALYMPVFKGFGQKLDADAKARLATLVERPNWLSENVDGECVAIAAKRLAAVPNVERRILIVLSDGQPMCPPSAGTLRAHLRQTVIDVSKSIEVVGIGINSNAVKDYYPNHVILNDVEELPLTVMKQLSDLLLKA